MLYQNDAYTFTLSLTHSDGGAPTVTTPPVIQIVRLSDFATMLSSPGNMIAMDNSDQLWVYVWSIGNAQSGDYAAIVSYAADGNVFSGAFLEKVRIGDSFILGKVALDGTVAKDATCAKDATVAHSTDLAAIDPNTSAVVASIKTATDRLPIDPAGMTLLADTIQNVADTHDALLGDQVVDKTQNPAVFTLRKVDNSVLAQYELTDTDTQTAKTRI